MWTQKFSRVLVWVWTMPFKIIIFPMVVIGVWLECRGTSSIWDVWKEINKIHWED